MAGSYSHCVTDDGRLRSPEGLAGMLENAGDVYEAIEEMYGMIWLLAAEGITRELSLDDPRRRVEDAERRYEQGLGLSPGIKR